MRRTRTSGFTLIEILVVMAISMLLFGLLFGPMVQSIGLTRRAQVMVATQNTARLTMDRMSREIAEAMFVYDNTTSPIALPVPVWSLASDAPVGGEHFEVYGAKLDLVLPKLVMHCNNPEHPDGQSRDYERGIVINDRFYAEAWPSCRICGSNNVEARPASPRRPEETVVRYFIGLLDPSRPYLNSYERGSGMSTKTGDNNPFVLYRAEFTLSDPSLYPQALSNNESERLRYLLTEPNFFYDAQQSAAGPPIWQGWKRVARVVGRDSDVDMIRIKWVRNGSEFQPTQVTPAVRFTPMGVDNDALAATYVSDEDAEMPEAIPTSFRATHGLWCPGFRVVVYTNDPNLYYTTGYADNGDLCIYGSGTDPVFNIDEYQRNANIVPDNPELMFTVDPDKGMVSFAFPGSAMFDLAEISRINADFKAEFEEKLALFSRGEGIRRTFLGPLTGNSRIIPGTETLIAPDMTPDDRYGLPVRYNRVPWHLGDPGRNQYKINYDTGEIRFSSRWEENIPEHPDGMILLNFRYHNNEPGMVVTADYATKMLVSIDLAIRLYDESSGKPHAVELSNRIRLRNAMR